MWLAKGDGRDPEQITSSQNLGFELFWIQGQLAASNRQSQWFRVGAKGGAIVPLFNDHELRFLVSACPNGKRLVYSTARNGNSELWTSDGDGGNATKITDKPLFAAGLCTPDSQSIIYATSEALWRAPVAGGAPEKTDLPLAQMGYSEDGKLMFRTSQAVEGDTLHAKFFISPANDVKTVLHSFAIPYGMREPRFTPDGKALALLLNRNRATNIWELPFSGGPPVPLTKFTSGDMFSFSWSRDGKQLALSRGQVKTDVILMTNFR